MEPSVTIIIMRGLFSDILIVLAQTGASTDNDSLFTLQRSPTKISVTLKGFLFHTNQFKDMLGVL